MSVFRRRLMSASKKGSVIDMPNYMTIEALEDGLTAKLTRTACEYSIDGGEWVSLAANTSTPAINTGHIISFKANNPSASSSYGIGTFTINKKCNLRGNCMSMLAYDDAANMTTVKLNGFRTLFKNCTNIVNVEKGFLPATTLNNYCYYQMFYGCSDLVNTPDLPSTSLRIYCYKEMFYGCSSLETPPELPATSTENYCYDYMFRGCKKIKEAPLLPAKKIRTGCYRGMFYNCSGITTPPELPATTLASYCYEGMFHGCTSLTKAPELPAPTLETYCYGGMFEDCTRMYDPPVLPATTLASYCYEGMFRGSGIRKLPELPATTLADYCYYYMFAECDIDRTTSLDLPAKTPADYCYVSMFFQCSFRGNITLYVHLLTNETTEGISGTSAFFDYVGLPSNVTFIGNSAYKGADVASIPALLREDFGIPDECTVLVEDF